ncbi:MAG: S-adenosyl-L-methionine-dependent methyltransferase [Monoraphidium minutum]|nr:MAG: S-adenosyl-L-methionine-dependent methyltransferase [Monoraphidium minutum]
MAAAPPAPGAGAPAPAPALVPAPAAGAAPAPGPAPAAAAAWHQVPYAEPSYWEARYGQEHQPFEWFLGYTALRRVLRSFLSKRKPVLQIGCGTSNIQEGMARSGWSVVNIDIASNVIEQLSALHAGVPGLSYAVADCRDMPQYSDCEFGSVLDKGTVDALLCSKDGVQNVSGMFSEASRVLTPGGVFLLVSLGDPARRLCLLCCERYDWTVQVVLLPKIAPGNQATLDGRRAGRGRFSVRKGRGCFVSHGCARGAGLGCAPGLRTARCSRRAATPVLANPPS